MLEMLWKMTHILYGIFLDNYIFATFFLLFYEMWDLPNNDVKKYRDFANF